MRVSKLGCNLILDEEILSTDIYNHCLQHVTSEHQQTVQRNTRHRNLASEAALTYSILSLAERKFVEKLPTSTEIAAPPTPLLDLARAKLLCSQDSNVEGE